MLRILILFFVLSFFNAAYSSTNEKIISKIKNINNLSFNFTQTINNKSDNGECIIKYPKKIFCSYHNSSKKIIVSNGKTLIIKNKNSNNHYIYPINKTPLKFLLDKNYLISKINSLNPKEINNKYFNFKIVEDNSEINVFFDNKSFQLIGWEIEDIYQNLAITFISSFKINQKINDEIFILPDNN